MRSDHQAVTDEVGYEGDQGKNTTDPLGGAKKTSDCADSKGRSSNSRSLDDLWREFLEIRQCSKRQAVRLAAEIFIKASLEYFLIRIRRRARE